MQKHNQVCYAPSGACKECVSVKYKCAGVDAVKYQRSITERRVTQRNHLCPCGEQQLKLRVQVC